jgi:hypothetical protein
MCQANRKELSVEVGETAVICYPIMGEFDS